ncbi:capsule assembly Wzi family protein [Dyadobacter sp. LJ53]|uniref:capsule assembly Wzi family protein n=1 Tax=Dyadobacter chenwenxiniae TaxID=2906456 RepID=UPI001F2E948C|nr:capsule assembly Wzi family protein [Dyadobacter chenwenxiniae]MCF0053971.1 capsule assembly Wzi family protein [Dyadobacter chenwenxiniae]
MRNLFLMLLLYVATQAGGFSQDSTFTYSAEIKGSLASTQTPYLLHTNTYGVIPTNGSFLLAQASLFKVYNLHNPRFFQWSGGAEFVARANKSSSVFFSDLFLAAKAGPIELSVGQWKEFYGLGDTLITSGAVAMSSNTRPYPKIQISTTRFVNIIPKNDIVAFKFTYSDGLLGPAKSIYGNVLTVRETYLHQKAIYIKLGRKSHILNLFAGFNHQVMWGGEDKIFSGGLKRSEAYGFVVLGKPWAASRVGNHFGTIDLGMQLQGKAWTTFLYRQSIYEDGSIANISNISDGLHGLRFKRNSRLYEGFKLNTVLLEYIYTKHQGGDVFDFVSGTFGRDNYFNHYVYSQGWSYKGRTLGTPLIAPQHLMRDELRSSTNLFTANNRLIAFHAGIEASLNKATFLFKASHSINSGTYNKPFRSSLDQTSLLARMETPLKFMNESHLNLSLGTDFGHFYPNNTAILIGWRKFGFIR